MARAPSTAVAPSKTKLVRADAKAPERKPVRSKSIKPRAEEKRLSRSRTIDEKPRQNRDDFAFLPAALEVVETPPSPIGRIGGYVMVAAFVFALLWAAIGQVDIVAVAKGKIIPTGYTKVVQPFETGVVRAIRVHDGQKVRAGELLIELDPTLNEADLQHQASDLMAARIDVARLEAALRAIIDPHETFVAPDGANGAQVEMGRLFFLGLVAQYRSKVAALAVEERQKSAEIDSLKVSIARVQALLPIMQERVQMRKTLYDHQNGSKILYLENLQELVGNQKDLELQRSRLKEADAALAAAEARRIEVQAEYRRSLLSELAEAQRKATGLDQEVRKAQQRTRFQALAAPIDGTVQQLSVHTVGGVVTPAQTLLAIVPSDSGMEIEAMVDNQDIGFVRPGQDAEVKVDTFSFTRYGLRHGKVISISQDAVGPEGGNQRYGRKDQPPTEGGADTPHEPAYAARVSLDRTDMRIDDKFVRLSPGMGVNVEIKTGTRRIISYLLSPLLQHAQESLRER